MLLPSGSEVAGLRSWSPESPSSHCAGSLGPRWEGGLRKDSAGKLNGRDVLWHLQPQGVSAGDTGH